MVSESPVDEDVDDVGERQEQVELEAIDQRRQDILRAYAFKTICRAVPVFKRRFMALEQHVVAMPFRHLEPKLLYDRQGFGPAHVAIAADHVGHNELSMRQQGLPDAIEEVLQLHNMVERLIRHHSAVLATGFPAVEVNLGEDEMLRNSCDTREFKPPGQH